MLTISIKNYSTKNLKLQLRKIAKIETIYLLSPTTNFAIIRELKIINKAAIWGGYYKKYMKKNLALALIIAFVFSLALNLPVKAEDEAVLTTNAAASSTIKMEELQRGNIDTSKLEKILSPDQIKYFKQIIKKDGVMYGVRLENKATSTIAATNGVNNREKISSPDQIKFFDKITQIGNALFGIRKSDEKKLENIASTSLEKIPSPDKISLYERITKIGNSLFGVRKNGLQTIDGSKPARLPVMDGTTIDCVSAAIDAKDATVSSALSEASIDIAKAITVRGACQKTALSLTSGDRAEEIRVCNKAFQEKSKTAHETAKNLQKEAWKTYELSLKDCSKKNSVSSEAADIEIEDGGQNSGDILVQ